MQSEAKEKKKRKKKKNWHTDEFVQSDSVRHHGNMQQLVSGMTCHKLTR